MALWRVLVLIQVASLRSARQAHALAQNQRTKTEIHQSRTEAELCAKPLAQISALSVGGLIGGLNFLRLLRHRFIFLHLERGAFLFACQISYFYQKRHNQYIKIQYYFQGFRL